MESLTPGPELENNLGQSLPKRDVRVTSVYTFNLGHYPAARRATRRASSGKSNQPAHSPARRCYLSGRSWGSET